jgi:hypothetical protein
MKVLTSLRKRVCDNVDWIQVKQDKDKGRVLLNTVINPLVPYKKVKFD